MNPIITIILLSSLVSPMGNLSLSFTIKGTSPVCGQNVGVMVEVLDQNNNVITTYSKVFHYTVNEVSSGQIDGKITIPLKITAPGTYYARVSVGYCGVGKVETIPFTAGGVVLDGYKVVVGGSGVIFDLKFRNTDVHKRVVFVKADVVTDANYSTAIVSEEEIPANTTAIIPVNVSVKNLPGSYANVSVGYIYFGKYYKVTSQIVPVPAKHDGEGTRVSTTVVLSLVVLVFIALIISKA